MNAVRRLVERVVPRGALILSVLSLAYFGVGLIRNRVLSSAFGSSTDYEAYVAAFRIPEIAFDVVVAAGLTAPFVPIFNALRERDPAGAERFGQTILTVAVLAMTVIALILVVVAPATVEIVAPDFGPAARAEYVAFVRLSCLAQVFFAASFVLGEVLVAHRRFFFYALAPVLYSAGIVLGTLILGGRLGVAGAAIGAVVGAAAHLVVRAIGIARTPFRVAPRLELGTAAIREFGRLMAPRLVSQPIDPLTVTFLTRLATGIGVGALTSYNYAADYQAVPVSLIGSAFSLAVFPTLVAAWNAGDARAYQAILRRNVATIGGLTMVAAIVLVILARPIIELVQGGGRFGPADVDRTALVLALFAASIPLDSLAYPLSRALYASHNTSLQFGASVVGFGTLVAVAAMAAGPLGIAAIPLGYSAGSAVKLGLLVLSVRRRIRLLDGLRPDAGAEPASP